MSGAAPLVRAIDEARRNGGGLILAIPTHNNSLTFEAMMEELGLPYVNVSEELACRLLSVPIPMQARRAMRELAAIIDPASPVVALGRLGLLHLPLLQLDPVRTLEQLARSSVIVAEWEGTYSGDDLVYASPGHSEYRHWKQPTFQIVQGDAPVP